MLRFILKSITSAISTLFLVSIFLFLMAEVGGGDISLKILGIFSTPEQRESFRNQLGLDAPSWRRYFDWLIGNDWWIEKLVGVPLITKINPSSRELEWWAISGANTLRWKFEDGKFWRIIRSTDNSTHTELETDACRRDENGDEYFWGIDKENRAVKWTKSKQVSAWILTEGGLRQEASAGKEYVPLRKGLVRGDAGSSLQYNRSVSTLIQPRIRNTAILASLAFIIVMPLALLVGIIAGVREGLWIDRVIALITLSVTAIPEFVTGIILILIFAVGLKILPAVALFTTSNAVFENPKMLILPVLTLTAIELGYVSRITRASMVEVMNAGYIKAAFVKGVPYWRVVFRHAVRNALMAPVTVIILHINWLIGGVVVTEIIFGYPGLGRFIYDAAIFGDTNALEAAAMVTVGIASLTGILGDLAYTFLNPRIRYS